MGFKSEAQRRKFEELVKQGKLDKSVLEQFNKDTPKGKKLPERVKKKNKDAIS